MFTLREDYEPVGRLPGTSLSNNGQLSAYWISNIDIVEIALLGLLCAAREGNWDLHLSAIRTLIPWCFAYDKVNYARYLSPYLAEMTSLPDKNPEVYSANSRFSCEATIPLDGSLLTRPQR